MKVRLDLQDRRDQWENKGSKEFLARGVWQGLKAPKELKGSRVHKGHRDLQVPWDSWAHKEHRTL